MDIDLTGPSIPRFLGIEAAKISQAPGGWVPVQVHSAQVLPPAPPPTYPSPTAASEGSNGAQDGSTPSQTSAANAPSNGSTSLDKSDESKPIGSLHAVSLAFLLASRSAAIVWRGPKKTAMVRQFLSDVLWPPLDYLLIDTPPGTSDEHISVVETLLTKVANPDPSAQAATPATTRSDGSSSAKKTQPRLGGAVVVTTPQAVAVSDVRKELGFCAKTGVRVVGVVENMSGYVCPCCGVPANIFSKGGGAVMAADYRVPFLGAVPIDGLWGQLVEEGLRPVYGLIDKHEEAVKGESGGSSQESNDQRMENDPPRTGDEETEGEDGRKKGLLIDKYRNCSLHPAFQAIASKVIDTVQNNAAAVVKPPA